MARVVEVTLHDAVVTSRWELELDDVADGSLDFIGGKGQAALADHDGDSGSPGLHGQDGCEDGTC